MSASSSAKKRKAPPKSGQNGAQSPQKRPKKVGEWTVEHVQSFLADKGYEEYVQASFEENEIDGEALLDLEAKELKEELGMTNLKQRKALLAEIEVLIMPISEEGLRRRGPKMVASEKAMKNAPAVAASKMAKAPGTPWDLNQKLQEALLRPEPIASFENGSARVIDCVYQPQPIMGRTVGYIFLLAAAYFVMWGYKDYCTPVETFLGRLLWDPRPMLMKLFFGFVLLCSGIIGLQPNKKEVQRIDDLCFFLRQGYVDPRTATVLDFSGDVMVANRRQDRIHTEHMGMLRAQMTQSALQHLDRKRA